MKRINEQESAKQFVERLRSGYFPVERSQNTELSYKDAKEARDTEFVRAFTQSALFDSLNKKLN